ncbi:MAG: hypothetical protein O7B27_04965 [Gammaproteobacteria bacterium]|nr:hypothetical protein [Gammaproteobacteria bacterium]
MKEIITNSSRIVNANIGLVLLVGVCNIRILSGVMTYVSAVGLAVSIVLGIVVYGRIIARIEGESCLRSIDIVKENWLNYILVVVLLAAPVLLFSQVVKLFLISSQYFFLAKEGLAALINMATIYVLPIVFIKKQNVVAIFAGIAYFIQNLKRSLPIVGLVAFMYIINIAAAFGFISLMQPAGDILSIVPVMVVFNTFVTYLSFMIFAAASLVLTEKPVVSVENGA